MNIIATYTNNSLVFKDDSFRQIAAMIFDNNICRIQLPQRTLYIGPSSLGLTTQQMIEAGRVVSTASRSNWGVITIAPLNYKITGTGGLRGGTRLTDETGVTLLTIHSRGFLIPKDLYDIYLNNAVDIVWLCVSMYYHLSGSKAKTMLALFS